MSFSLVKLWAAAKGIFTDPVPKPAPVPPVVVPDSPAPVPPVDSGTAFTLLQRSIPGGWVNASWKPGAVPLYGNNPVNLRKFTGTWYEAIFTVTRGTLTISDIGVSGPYSPKIQGAVKGKVLKAGDSMHLKFSFTKPLLIPKITKQVNYEIWTKEAGQIVHLSGYTADGN